MHEMDLIPAAYRRRRAKRQRQRAWGVALGLWVALGVGVRLWIERGLAQERAWQAQWQPLQDKARAERAELQHLQTLITQARPPEGPPPAHPTVAPLSMLPSVLAMLPPSGLRLSAATLEPSAEASARLTLQGQAMDEPTLSRAVMLLREHPQVKQVQLLSVKPDVAGEQRFELLLRVSPSAASAPSAAAADSAGERP